MSTHWAILSIAYKTAGRCPRYVTVGPAGSKDELNALIRRQADIERAGGGDVVRERTTEVMSGGIIV